MKRLTALLALIAATISITGAAAREPVRLEAVAPAGDRAVLIYGKTWAEVTLKDEPSLAPIFAPRGCDWTSAAYEPGGDRLALTAYCPTRSNQCEDAQSILFLAEGGRRPRRAITGVAARWDRAIWRAGAGDLLIIEAPLYAPIATSLDTLNTRGRSCAYDPARFAILDPGRQARIGLGILPGRWSPRSIIAARPDRITALLRIDARVSDGSPAARRIAEICANAAEHPPQLQEICLKSGAERQLTWADGEWRLDEDAALSRGRRFLTSTGAEAAETCTVTRINGRMRPKCQLAVTSTTGSRQITAPLSLFGDIALTKGYLFSLWATRGVPKPHFIAYDLNSDSQIDLTPLLDPYQFPGFPLR